MFADAIEAAARYTRAIHTIARRFGSQIVEPGAATFFFINSDGWALTCKHVADMIPASDKINSRYSAFRQELTAREGQAKKKQLRREVERKFGLDKGTPAELHLQFMGAFDGATTVKIITHPEFDLALLHFTGFVKLHCDSFPSFPSDTTGFKPGRFLCRLGFPFPEFSNFAFDPVTETISWTNTGNPNSPRFPIEGMVTRGLLSVKGQRYGFELSTAGLRGQSGCPAFDREGRVWGVQSATAHLDLDFDVDQQVLRQGQAKHVRDHAFLHVGNCIHVDVIRAFLRDNDVAFNEV